MSKVVSCFPATPSRENLLKFPHLAAIQHNNCMYLAHQLLTLGHHFRAHLPQPLSEGVATFVDMVPGFRNLGKQTVFQLSAAREIRGRQNLIPNNFGDPLTNTFSSISKTTFTVHNFHSYIWNINILSADCLEVCWAPFCHFPLGAKCFLAQMNVQRAELLERLSTAHNFCNLDDDDNYTAASKAVRQVRGKVLKIH